MSQKDQYNGPEILPPKDHPQLGMQVMSLLEEIMDFKKSMNLHEKWVKAYEFSRNKHWRNTNVPVKLLSANLLFNHRQRTTAQLTDNNPTFNVKQVGEVAPEKEELFDMLLRTAEFWWQDQEQQQILEKSIINGEMYGGTAEKVFFNPEFENGLGEVETMVIDPFYFGWYPYRQPYCPTKTEAVLYYYPESTRKLKRKYPELASRIKSDSEILEELGDSRIGGLSDALTKKKESLFSTIGGIVKDLTNLRDSTGSLIDDDTLLIECWIRDYSTDESGAYIYPGTIRRVIVCSGGEVVISDEANPSINPNIDPEQASISYLYSRFPFTFTQSITDTSDPWGMSDFEQLMDIQIELNKTLSQSTTLKDKLARLKIINPKDSGVSNRHFTERGIINPSSLAMSQGLRFMDPPRFPPELASFLTIYTDLFQKVAGNFELESMQKDGTGQIAYKSIAALLERAHTLLRSKVRNYSKMIRERGRMYLSCAMNWYTEPRWVSYEEDGESLGQLITGPEIMIPAKLNVVSGSTMPVSRIQEREEAINLFQQGAIDNEELLKKMDWPDWKNVILRLKAGPLGEFINKLSMMGFPEEFLVAMQEIASMEQKDFEKALKDGEIPQAADIIPGPEDYGPEQPPTIPPDMQAQLEEINAKIAKLMADTDLTRAKIDTERINQQVSLAGVQFDKDKLVIERARTVADIKRGADESNRMAAEVETAEAEQKEQGPYREKGISSNNKSKKKKRRR